MNQSVDMNPAQFNRHARALEARYITDQLRKNENPHSNEQPKRLSVDFAHVTDSVNFLLASWDCNLVLRGFIDAVIGVAGYRAGGDKWFKATDRKIALRANRSTKWVQNQRKQLVSWQTRHNVAPIDIEDNKYNQGDKRPHKYRVNIARLVVETILDAKDSCSIL